MSISQIFIGSLISLVITLLITYHVHFNFNLIS